MKRIYLFDLEGVLCQTKNIYLKTLIATFFEYKDHFDNSNIPIPTSKALEAVIKNHPFSIAKEKIFKSYPFLSLLNPGLEKKFYEILQEEIKYADDIEISSSIAVFKHFYSLGCAVIFTNAPKEIAKILLKRISINIKDDDLVCCEKFFKPEREAFLTVLEKLNVSPSSCTLIDDSLENISAAVSMGIKGVYFKNSENQFIKQKVFLSKNKVDVTSDLYNLKDFQSIKKENTEIKNKNTFKLYDLKKISEEGKIRLAEVTYPVYRALFYGRNYDDWKNKFITKETCDSLIYIARCGDQVVGFCWSEFFDIKQSGETLIAVKYYTAFLKKYRNRWLVQKGFMLGLLFGIKKYKKNKIVVFENIASPFAYKNGCLFFGNLLFPQPGLFPKKDLIELVLRLSDYFGYKKLDTQNPFLVKSQSMVFILPEQLEILDRSKDSYYKYYLDQTKMQPGVGIASIITIKNSIIYYLFNTLKVGVELCRHAILRRFRSK